MMGRSGQIMIFIRSMLWQSPALLLSRAKTSGLNEDPGKVTSGLAVFTLMLENNII